MPKVVSLDAFRSKRAEKAQEDTPHVVDELVCLRCLHRSLRVFPITVDLDRLECDSCGETGYCISSGQAQYWTAREEMGYPAGVDYTLE